MKRSMVTKLGLLVLVGLVATAVVAALAFGHSTRQGRIAAPPSRSALFITGLPAMNVLSFSFKLTNTISFGSAGGGAGVGKANFSDVTLTLPVDSSLPPLSVAVARGDHFQKAVLTDVWTNATGNLVALKDGFTNVFITSVEQDGSGGPGSSPTEKVTLLAEQTGWSYYATGDTTTTPTSIGGWDRISNVAMDCTANPDLCSPTPG